MNVSVENYKRNNFELAVSLNDMRNELNIVKYQVLTKNRELQQAHEEVAKLRQELAQRDGLIAMWRTSFIEMMQTNSKNYANMMQKIGLVTPANGTVRPNATDTNKPLTNGTLVKKEEPSANTLRRRPLQRVDDSPLRLPDLVEENSLRSRASSSFNSMPDLSNISASSTSSARVEGRTPERRAAVQNVTHRRRSSVPPADEKSRSPSPTDSTRSLSPTMDNAKRSTKRPSRRARPKSLTEPKLGMRTIHQKFSIILMKTCTLYIYRYKASPQLIHLHEKFQEFNYSFLD